MRNESLYVPSRVNRDKLFFMFSDDRRRLRFAQQSYEVHSSRNRNALFFKSNLHEVVDEDKVNSILVANDSQAIASLSNFNKTINSLGDDSK